MPPPRDIGLLRNYVGKHFFIRCQQDLAFLIDSSFRQNTGGGQLTLYVEDVPNNANQVWTVDAEGRIMNVQNPNSILYAQRTANSAPVVLVGMRGNPQANTALAKWSMNEAGEIVSMADGNFMLNVQGGVMSCGKNIIVYQRQGPAAKNDKWKLTVLPQQVVKPSDIGLFKAFVGTHFYIRSKLDTSFTIDTAFKQIGGGEPHLWVFEDHNPNQIWTVDSAGHLINVQNPNAILIAGNTNSGAIPYIAGRKDNPEAETDLARWSLNREGEIVSMANANVMLNICGGKAERGKKIIMFHRQGPHAMNDKWVFQLEDGFELQKRGAAEEEEVLVVFGAVIVKKS